MKGTRKTYVVCSICKVQFALDDAPDCPHVAEQGYGSVLCPNGHCICQGDTAEEIREGFEQRVTAGTMIKVRNRPFDYICANFIEK